MYNWSSQPKQHISARGMKRYQIWSLEQTINFGLNGQKLDKQALKEHWNDLNIDPYKRRFLSFLLWNKLS